MKNVEEIGYDFCVLHTNSNGNAKNIKLIKKGDEVMVNK